MARFLSFDCANRSLAVCYATHNQEYTIHFANVYDVTKTTTKTEKRALLLKRCLNKIDAELKNAGLFWDVVLIEYQMSANDKSRCVSNQILYHYAEYKTVLVGPSLKNKVHFAPELRHNRFIEKYASKYTANKNHTKANFLHWIEENNRKDLIANIKKKNIDDLADAFMQIVGFVQCG